MSGFGSSLAPLVILSAAKDLLTLAQFAVEIPPGYAVNKRVTAHRSDVRRSFAALRMTGGNLPSSPIVSSPPRIFAARLALTGYLGLVLYHLGMTGIDSLRKLRVSVPGVDGSSPVKKSIKQQLATIRTPWLPNSELGNCHRSAWVSFYTWEFGAS
jgi:hypothetical protein